MIFRVRYQIFGSQPHVYCELYVAPHPNETFALCGWFTVRKEEFAPMREAFAKVEFVRQERDQVEKNKSPCSEAAS